MKAKIFLQLILKSLLLTVVLCNTVCAEGLNNLQMLSTDWSNADSYNKRLSFFAPLTTTASILVPPRAYPGTAGTFTRASAQRLVNDSNVLTSFASGTPELVAKNGDRIITIVLSKEEAAILPRLYLSRLSL